MSLAAALTQAANTQTALQTQLAELCALLSEHDGDDLSKLPRCLMCNHPYGDLAAPWEELAVISAKCGCRGVGYACMTQDGLYPHSGDWIVHGCGLTNQKCYKCRRRQNPPPPAPPSSILEQPLGNAWVAYDGYLVRDAVKSTYGEYITSVKERFEALGNTKCFYHAVTTLSACTCLWCGGGRVRCLFCDHPYGDPKGGNDGLDEMVAACGCVGVGWICASGSKLDGARFVSHGCGRKGEKCANCRN